MLGIFLIICIVIFWFTKLKAYKLSRIICNQSAESTNDQLCDIRHQAVRLHAISGATAVIGYLGCLWPYLFNGISNLNFIIDMVLLGIIPALFIAGICYLDIRFVRNPAQAGMFPFNFWLMLASLPLFYTSYCCIDYDFFRKDYTALFNNWGSDANQTENAWPYYVESAKHYTKLEDSFQEVLRTGLQSDRLNLSNEDRDKLQKWFEENSSSWANLKKAASINYCNSAYETISFSGCKDANDFVRNTMSFFGSINNFYGNVTVGQYLGIFDFDWLNLLQMEFKTSKQFINGKTFPAQLLGYSMLKIGTKLLANQDNYTSKDLQKVRELLQEYFSDGLLELNTEGEILMLCATYDEDIQSLKLPVVTPLNYTFIHLGSISGFEAYARKQYRGMLEAANKGVEFKPKGLSVIKFPTQRKKMFDDNGNTSKATAKVYKIYQRAKTNLSAAYVLLDIEEYKLNKGSYPTNITELGQAGFSSQLPDDPDANDKIIYRNDGQRAVLYAVGENSIDDGGYKDDKNSDKNRDDIIYWQRTLKEEK